MHRGFRAKNSEKKGPGQGTRRRPQRPRPSAPPEIEPEEAAVVEAAGDDEQPRPAGGVVEPA